MKGAFGSLPLLYDVAGGLKTHFTFDAAEEAVSIWSPDGSRLVFDSNQKGHMAPLGDVPVE
jgi:Tol biopolymer transport system component